jgi:hypothetical protein
MNYRLRSRVKLDISREEKLAAKLSKEIETLEIMNVIRAARPSTTVSTNRYWRFKAERVGNGSSERLGIQHLVIRVGDCPQQLGHVR